DIQLQDVGTIATHADGPFGVHAKVYLRGADPLVAALSVLPFDIDGWCEVDTFFDGGTLQPIDIYAKCEHNAFPSYELYVAGVQVMTHSAFSHSPGDLGSPLPAIATKHHCERVQNGGFGEWQCKTE